MGRTPTVRAWSRSITIESISSPRNKEEGMITTQYGSEVVILARMGDGWARVKRVADGAIREWHVAQLRGSTPADLLVLHDIEYGDVSAQRSK